MDKRGEEGRGEGGAERRGESEGGRGAGDEDTLPGKGGSERASYLGERGLGSSARWRGVVLEGACRVGRVCLPLSWRRGGGAARRGGLGFGGAGGVAVRV